MSLDWTKVILAIVTAGMTLFAGDRALTARSAQGTQNDQVAAILRWEETHECVPKSK